MAGRSNDRSTLDGLVGHSVTQQETRPPLLLPGGDQEEGVRAQYIRGKYMCITSVTPGSSHINFECTCKRAPHARGKKLGVESRVATLAEG